MGRLHVKVRHGLRPLRRDLRRGLQRRDEDDAVRAGRRVRRCVRVPRRATGRLSGVPRAREAEGGCGCSRAESGARAGVLRRVGFVPRGTREEGEADAALPRYMSTDGRSAVERSKGGLGDAPGCENRHPRAARATAVARAEAALAAASTSSGVPDATSSSSASDGAHLPHVKNWLRTKHAVLFRLSNRTIQVCFQDGSEVLLSSEASACVFTSKGGVRGCH